MIGGTVIGVVTKNEECLLNIQDENDECAVRCGNKRLDNGETIRIYPGDKVWWQCGKVYWNPEGPYKCRYDSHDEETKGLDIPLKKIDYSH